MHQLRTLFLCLGIHLLGQSLVLGAPLFHYEYTARVSFGDIFAGVMIPEGTLADGTFLYDANLTDSAISETRGVYRQLRPNGFTMNVGGVSVTAHDVTFEIDGGFFMVHNFGFSEAPMVNGDPLPVRFLLGISGMPLDSDALPLSLQFAEGNSAALSGVDGHGPLFRVESLNEIPAAEPSTFALLLTSIAGLYVVRQHRTKHWPTVR